MWRSRILYKWEVRPSLVFAWKRGCDVWTFPFAFYEQVGPGDMYSKSAVFWFYLLLASSKKAFFTPSSKRNGTQLVTLPLICLHCVGVVCAMDCAFFPDHEFFLRKNVTGQK